jgi:hypothetical protein
MNQKVARRLHSLAHPLVSLGKRDEETKEGLFLPPFPEINLNWEGFCLSHLNFLGIKYATRKTWQAEINSKHELHHQDLGFTPFSLLKKHEVLISYNLILRAFKNPSKQILVPIKPIPALPPPLLLDAIEEDRNVDAAVSRESLQRQLATIVCLDESSNLYEEIYVIRSSLSSARKTGSITNSRRQKLIAKYKDKYKEVMQEFPELYDAFDFVAGKIGETAARHIISNAFRTIVPNRAFLDIINILCEFDSSLRPKDILWNLSDKQANGIKNSSDEEVDLYFYWILSQIDPLDFGYRRLDIDRHTVDLERQWGALIQDNTMDNFLEIAVGQALNIYLYTAYSYDIHPFPHVVFPLFCKVEDLGEEVKVTKGIYYGSVLIVLEAIRQQLTQGIGLLCPFWSWNHTCCSIKIERFLRMSGLTQNQILHATGNSWVVLLKDTVKVTASA